MAKAKKATSAKSASKTKAKSSAKSTDTTPPNSTVDMDSLKSKLSSTIDMDEFEEGGEDAAEARALAMMIAEGKFDEIGSVKSTNNNAISADDSGDFEEVGGDSDSSSSDSDPDSDSDDNQVDSAPTPTPTPTPTPINFTNNKKGLLAASALLTSRNLEWPERFTVGGGALNLSEADAEDDIKREVAFYELALRGVTKGEKSCAKFGIPFRRPEDFFAEMVKSDEQMGKIKDRLIFEKKKMEAFEQRKSSKEQKLRYKEKQSDALKQKAKHKSDNLKAVDEWAKNAAQNRGTALSNDDGYDKTMLDRYAGNGKGEKRKRADSKFGHGGKRGRFKQMDKKTINDMSSYNPRGNFGGGMKSSKKTGMQKVGGGRKGKRARDSNRAKR